MAEYFKSKQVTVYPCSYRGKFNSTDKTIKQVDPEANMFTENTIRKSGLRINGRDTGLISFGKNQDKYDIEVLIHGYYFKITEIAFADLAIEDEEDEGNYTDTKYLQILTKPITLEDRNTEILASQNPDNVDYLDTDGDDENGDFVGLKIVETKPDTDYYYIKPCLLSSDKSELVANEEEKQVNVRHGAGESSININLDDTKPNVTQGNGTITVGNNNTNNDDYNIVIGEDNTISGTHSLAIGTKLNIDANYAVAIGQPNTGLTTPTAATGNFAFAQGSTAQANGDYSYARGQQTIADGDYSFAAGLNATADSLYSYAFGYISSATADYAHAEGGSSTADGTCSYAFGGGVNAHGDYSRAIGYISTAYSNYSYVMGCGCAAGDSNNPITGTHAHAEGNYVKALGDYSFAFGNHTAAFGTNSLAFGDNSCANKISDEDVQRAAVADGFGPAFGEGAIAYGKNNCALGSYSYVNGTGNTAGIQIFNKDNVDSITAPESGKRYYPGALVLHENQIHVCTEKIESYSRWSQSQWLAVGIPSTWDTTVSSLGDYIHISGSDCTAINKYAFVHGKSISTQGGQHTVSFGNNIINNYSFANAFGANLITTNTHQTVFGYYNDQTLDGYSRLFTIGNGNSDLRHDAFNIDTDGKVTITYSGSTSDKTTTIDENIVTAGSVTATSFYATSDKRLKENITSYKPEKSILDLPVYKYDFINGSKNQIGCLAQDLQEICPELVESDKDGYLHIQESKLVYLLLEEVKELKKEVKELKDKR